MSSLTSRFRPSSRVEGTLDTLFLDQSCRADIFHYHAKEQIEMLDRCYRGGYISLVGQNHAYSHDFPDFPPQDIAYHCMVSVLAEDVLDDRLILPKGGRTQVIRLQFPLNHGLVDDLQLDSLDPYLAQFEFLSAGYRIPLKGELLRLAQSVWACPYTGNVRHMWLQGKIREILALLMIHPKQTSLAQRACQLIQNNPGYPWRIRDLSRQLGTNECYLKKAFRDELGMGVASWIQQYRMEQAAQCLKCPGDSILTIALNLGFAHASHFAKVFKQHYGMSPKEFRLSGL